MKAHPYNSLSKRERQIMDVVHRLGEASVGDVYDQIPDPTGYNSVRILMGILEKKGFLSHHKEKKKYIYKPTLKHSEAKKSAIDHLLSTHFNKSVPQVVSALLSLRNITDKELDELEKMIGEAKKNATND